MERKPLRSSDAMVRLWTINEMDWIMAPRSSAPGDEVRWAGKVYAVVRHNGERRVKLMRGA